MSNYLPDGCTDHDVDVAAGGYDPPEPEQKFDEWDYRVSDLTGESVFARFHHMQRMGLMGWELVCVDSGIAYFKRLK